MLHARAYTGRRIAAAAVVVALAATGGAVSAPPATAAALTAQDGAQAPVPYPKGDAPVVGGGTAGFFVSVVTDGRRELRWTRYADGTTKVLPYEDTGRHDFGGSDVLVEGDHATDILRSRVLTVHDLASGAEPYVVDLAAREKDGETYHYRGAVGSTLLVGVREADGGGRGLLLTPGPDGVRERVISGFSEDLAGFSVVREGTTSGLAVVFEVSGPVDARRYSRAVLDVASGRVLDSVPVPSSLDQRRPGTASATHVVWAGAGDPALAVGARGTAAMRRTAALENSEHGLVGDWFVHGSAGQPLLAERADGTGGSVRVLDRVRSLAQGPDGSLLARGGTVARGEGLYRITSGGEGAAPVAELVATTGEPTALEYRGADLPGVFDLDRAAGGFDLRWRLSRKDVRAWVTFTRVRGGGLEDEVVRRPLWGASSPMEPYVPQDMGSDAVGFTWRGEDFDTPGRGAEAGTYTWRFEAEPLDGLGAPVTASGSFTVRRAPGGHDFDGNGAPELFGRETNGAFTSYDLVPKAAGDGPAILGRARVGTGWDVYDRVEATGDVAGTPLADLVARDRSGVLWLHQGAGHWKTPFLGRVRVGGGWNAYDRLTGGSDLTGDGRADLVAADRAGGLWLYRSTGDAGAPFAARVRIGGGWQVYDELTATGNIGGAAPGDLVARDKAGVLWLYLGRGDGTFAARTRIGGGWGGFRQLVGTGDVDGDGRRDLLARSTGSAVTFYAGTGAWRAPFEAARKQDLGIGADEIL
ncbi:FG-GAP-like repeat-containing protein [Streptomyces sp. NPDC014773]|uniref:FG-GAP-like repeat-containing protein n=1 Tax=Streptomyces sp. NPDC014773 TaxID=3364908 RepID=UPI00370340BC